jgi:hypothetical protein
MILRLLILMLLATTLAYAGGSRDFDATGTSQYITVTTSSALQPAFPLTVMGWIKSDISDNEGGIISLGGGSDAADPFNYNGIAFLGDSNSIKISYGDNTGRAQSDRNNSSADYTASGWVHVASVANGFEDLQLFANGVGLSETYSGTATTMVYNATVPKVIGGVHEGTQIDTGREFDGKIADVRVYSRALSTAEINEAMNCLNYPNDGLIGQWLLNESGADPSFQDISKNSNNGTNTGSIESSDGPPTGWCGGAR